MKNRIHFPDLVFRIKCRAKNECMCAELCQGPLKALLILGCRGFCIGEVAFE